MSSSQRAHVRWIAAYTALSWLGEYVHNLVDLPRLTALSPENSIPALISLMLFFAWWRLPYKRLAASAMLGWALVQLIGGILSVIPFGFLPYEPAQTVKHYLMHALYALAQLPLIAALIWQLKRDQASQQRSSQPQV